MDYLCYADGNDYIGSLGGMVANEVFSDVFVGYGENGYNYDFGELKLGSIEGNVWEDRNDNGVIDAGENVIANVETKLQIEKIMEVIRKVLSPREYQILVLRYGIGGGPELTKKEVAKKFGISRSYVSRIEKKALDKIREEIKDEF